jgi:hypothetical protein
MIKNILFMNKKGVWMLIGGDSINGNTIVVPCDNDNNDDIWGDKNMENNNDNKNASNPNPTIVDEEKDDGNGFEGQGLGDDNLQSICEIRCLDGFTNP